MDDDNNQAWMYSGEYQAMEGDSTPLPPLVVTLPLAAADAAGFVAQRQQPTEDGDQRGSYDPLFNGNGSSDEEEGEGGERGTATPATLATAGRGSMAAATTSTTEAMDESVDYEETESEEEEEDDIDVSDDDGEEGEYEEDEKDEDTERLLEFLHGAAKRGACVWIYCGSLGTIMSDVSRSRSRPSLSLIYRGHRKHGIHGGPDRCATRGGVRRADAAAHGGRGGEGGGGAWHESPLCAAVLLPRLTPRFLSPCTTITTTKTTGQVPPGPRGRRVRRGRPWGGRSGAGRGGGRGRRAKRPLRAQQRSFRRGRRVKDDAFLL